MTSATVDRRLGLVGNTAIKAPVACATTANITLSGEQTIDGVLTSSSRVLVKDQTNTVQNGIYDSSSGSWTRALDFNGNYDIVKGTLVGIAGGTQQDGAYYEVTSANPITVGTSAITFTTSVAVGNLAAQLASTASASYGAGMVGYDYALAYAADTVGAKLREFVSVKDFGAIGNGIADDTTAFQAMSTYVNAITNNDRWPVGVYFPQGQYKYSAGLAFTRPVVLFSYEQATLNYTGNGIAVKLGPDDIVAGSDVPLEAEYCVDGLRFQNGASCTHGIYVNDFISEPRIRNCTFVDFGNETGGSYCIYFQYSNWNILVENCRYLCLNITGAGLHFINATGLSKTPGAGPPYVIDPSTSRGYDGGNSRITIRDCWMTHYNSQQLGLFAGINATSSRIIGGGFQWSNYGIYLSGFASETIIDGVYCEIDTGITNPYFITAVTTTTDGPVTWHPESVQVRNCYVNLHGLSGARFIYTNDASLLLKNWDVSAIITDPVVSHQLFTLNDTAVQTGNRADIRRLSSDSNPTREYTLHNAFSSAEPWATPNGFAIETVGDAVYTLKQTDIGKTKLKNGTTARNWTLPSDTTALIELGAVVYVLHGGTVANVSLIADGGVTIVLAGTASTGTRTLAPNAIARCIKVASNVWYVDGPGVT